MSIWMLAALSALGGALLCALIAWHIHLHAIRRAQQEAKALLARMQKLEQVRSTFVANVTHELKTPLTSIKGYIELLKSGPRDEQTRAGFYDIIEIEAERLHALIEDILQLSEIENSRDNPRQQVFLLRELGDEILARFRPLADKNGISLDVFIPSDMSVRANPYRLKQLLNNLVDNAIKYNVPNGCVRLRAWRDAEHTFIQVSDTGIGMMAEHLPHIFERFYRVDKGRSRDLGGTGLGLSIVKHVVQLHGGDISVESDPGQGTRFVVRLPHSPG